MYMYFVNVGMLVYKGCHIVFYGFSASNNKYILYLPTYPTVGHRVYLLLLRYLVNNSRYIYIGRYLVLCCVVLSNVTYTHLHLCQCECSTSDLVSATIHIGHTVHTHTPHHTSRHVTVSSRPQSDCPSAARRPPPAQYRSNRPPAPPHSSPPHRRTTLLAINHRAMLPGEPPMSLCSTRWKWGGAGGGG